jgi:hypothetical protein
MSATSDEGLDRVELLEAIRRQGKEWDVLAPRYGVAGGALPALERRKAEDELAEAVYRDVPGPERELLALVHTMLSRGLLAEGELAARMRAVRSRLEKA